MTVKSGTAKPMAYQEIKCAPAFERIGGRAVPMAEAQPGPGDGRGPWSQ
jgi:hypothetical protein